MKTEGLCCLADPCQAVESDTAPSLLLMENAPRGTRLLWLGKKRVCQPGGCTAQREHGCNRLAPASSKQCEIANAWGMSRWQLASKEGCCYGPSRFASAAWQSRQETSHILFCKGKCCTRHPSWLFHLALVRSTRDPVRGIQMHSVREKALWFSILRDLFPSPQKSHNFIHPFSRRLSFTYPTSCTFPFLTFLSPAFCHNFMPNFLPPPCSAHCRQSPSLPIICLHGAVLEECKECVVKALCG